MTGEVSTRERILESAMEVFAGKGYRDATVADICEKSDANIAAVNYHFGSKKNLYVEVWRQVIRQAEDLYPFKGGVADDAPPEERLRGHVTALMRRMTDNGRLGHLHRLMMMEMVNPSGCLDEAIKAFKLNHRELLRSVLRDLLGPDAGDETIDYCEVSIVGQCRAARMGRPGKQLPSMNVNLSKAEVERIIKHICAFSLGGLKAIKEGGRS